MLVLYFCAHTHIYIRVRDRAKGWGSALNTKAQQWGSKAKDKWEDGTFWSTSLASLPWLSNIGDDDDYDYGPCHALRKLMAFLNTVKGDIMESFH